MIRNLSQRIKSIGNTVCCNFRYRCKTIVFDRLHQMLFSNLWLQKHVTFASYFYKLMNILSNAGTYLRKNSIFRFIKIMFFSVMFFFPYNDREKIRFWPYFSLPFINVPKKLYALVPVLIFNLRPHTFMINKTRSDDSWQ